MSGWTKLEDAAGLQIPVESRRAVITALAQFSRAHVAGERTVGSPLLQPAVEWLAAHMLGLAPELQSVLVALAEKDLEAVPVPEEAPLAPSPRAEPPQGTTIVADRHRQHDGGEGAPAPEEAHDMAEQRLIAEVEAAKVAEARRVQEEKEAEAAAWRAEKMLQQEEAQTVARRAAAAARAERDGARLQTAFAAQKKRPEYRAMLKIRSKLPATAQRREVVEAVASNQVVVISGATGCGKSTQVVCLGAPSGWSHSHAQPCRSRSSFWTIC